MRNIKLLGIGLALMASLPMEEKVNTILRLQEEETENK